MTSTVYNSLTEDCRCSKVTKSNNTIGLLQKSIRNNMTNKSDNNKFEHYMDSGY